MKIKLIITIINISPVFAGPFELCQFPPVSGQPLQSLWLPHQQPVMEYGWIHKYMITSLNHLESEPCSFYCQHIVGFGQLFYFYFASISHFYLHLVIYNNSLLFHYYYSINNIGKLGF